MKIAFFADINDNHNQKWLSLLANEHSLILFTLANSPVRDLDFEVRTNIKVYPILPAKFSIKNIFYKNKTIKEIETILTTNNIEIIHSIYSIPYSLWAGSVEKNNHIITTYGSDILIDYNITWKNPNSLKQRITFFILKNKLRTTFQKAKFITSTSVEQQNVIKQFITDKTKLIITRTGVDCERFIAQSANYKKQTNEITILSNRAMRPLYNINIIIDAFHLFKKEYTQIPVRLILFNYNTDESYFSLIKKQIEKYNLENSVNILNDLNFEELVPQYTNCDIVVMIPKSDGTPVSGIETLLAKKPLIMGNLNYDEDLFNENTIWKLENIDAEHLYKKMIGLINTSPVTIKNKTDKGYLIAQEKASLKTEVGKILNLYQKIADKNEC